VTIPAGRYLREPSGRHIFMSSFRNDGGLIMNTYKRPGPADISRPFAMEADQNIRGLRRDSAATFRQVENGGDTSAHNLRDLLGRVLETSTGEVDRLIDELQTLRRRLQGDGDRIQSDIAKYAELSEQVMQVTKIVSESVHKLPEAPNISP
jgi:hypothetical protein